MKTCCICQSNHIRELLDFGEHPICNRFLKHKTDFETKFPLSISQCTHCGLIQLADPIPASELIPAYEWIKYNEAESHLDSMVEELLKTINPDCNAKIHGTTYKDSSTLERLKKNGFNATIELDPKKDLNINSDCAGIESIQEKLTESLADKITGKYGLADILIARHILEHAHDMHELSKAFKTLLKPDGYIVIEIPDFTISLDKFDYSTVWEEHITYFTSITFQQYFCRQGFNLKRLLCYPYPLENSLVGIAQCCDNPEAKTISGELLDTELSRAKTYMNNFGQRKTRINDLLENYRKNIGPIAMFGAGHLACKFINLMALTEHFEFAVDDHPEKKGMFIPGSRLPIYGSSALLEHQIKLCLLSLNPENEEKVLQKNQVFADQGGTFASIFPASPSSLRF